MAIKTKPESILMATTALGSIVGIVLVFSGFRFASYFVFALTALIAFLPLIGLGLLKIWDYFHR